MVINFMGLAGPSGVLPLYYTELIVERLRQKDRALLSFFDIFNHRMISLFYQAWEKYRFAIAYERGERDRFSHHLMDLIGIGTKRLDNRLAVRDDSLLFYSGLLSMHTAVRGGARTDPRGLFRGSGGGRAVCGSLAGACLNPICAVLSAD